MKRQKRTILGVFLTLMLLGSLVAAVAPVSASTLSWGDEDIPDTSGKVLLQLAASNNDSLDIAVFDEDTIYVAGGEYENPDESNNDWGVALKSTNGGDTWSLLDDSDFEDTLFDLVAVAPDDEDLVVLVSSNDSEDGIEELFISTNGGSSFGSLGAPAGITDINDIAVSPEDGGSHYIAVAGEDDGVGEVWFWEHGATVPSWEQIGNNTGEYPGWDEQQTPYVDYSTANTSAAVAFSPSFPGDQVLLVVTENDNGLSTGDDWVLLQIFSFNSEEWNDEAGFDDYPGIIVKDDDIDGLDSASLSLDPEYLGSDDAMRLAFVGLTVDGGDSNATDLSGIYRMDDEDPEELKDEVEIHSVAYDGTNLIAGRYDDTHVYYSDDPTDSSPTIKTTRSLKRPGGEDRVLVAWAGDNAVAVTEGDESAFARSTNLGQTFNDISLIDTDTDVLSDVALTADADITYLVSADSSDDLSVWLMASDWVRILSIQNIDNDFLVRIAPNDPDVVYIVDQGGDTIYYTSDGGQIRWQTRTFSDSDLQDLAVEGDGDVLYALRTNGEVLKSSNSGFTWGSSEATGLDSGYMIVSLGEDNVLVTSQDGDDGPVAWSTDGNNSWDDTGEDLAGSGNVSAAASGLEDGDFIWAGVTTTNDDIYRWEIGESSSWKKLKNLEDDLDLEDHGVYGMNLTDGILYAASSNGTDSALIRSINPTSGSAGFDAVVETGVDFSTVPQALTSTSGSTILWAIDVDEPMLYSFKDTLTTAVPTLVAPAQDFNIKMNPVTGRAVMVSFIWESPSDDVEAFDLEIAFDDGFDESIYDQMIEDSSDEGDTIVQVIGPYATGDHNIEWTFGSTYFWRVRVAGNEPFKSNWSDVRRFVIEEATTQPPVQIDIPPVPPAPDITVTVPDVIVNIPPLVEVPPSPAPITPGWIWVIVILGGVLVIGLIVLIVRTRRAV